MSDDKGVDLKNNNTIKALKILLNELSQTYNKSEKEIIELILEDKNESEKNKQKDFEKKEIPLTLFQVKAGYLELVCYYAKEILDNSFADIARILNRDQRTVWTSHNKLKNKIANKKVGKIDLEKTDLGIPLSIFNDRTYSPLENLSLYLLKTYSTKKIAELLKKDYKTIWTAIDRTRKKQNEKKTEREKQDE